MPSGSLILKKGNHIIAALRKPFQPLYPNRNQQSAN